jgi:cyclase
MPADPMDTPTIVKVGDGFHVRQAVDTIAWMDLGDGALVVDALEQAHLEREVFEAIRSTLGDVPVRYVLNTHTHGDHTALNAAFQRRFGAEIVNARTRRIPPEGVWLEGPRRRVQMLPMGGCHTAEDCVVWGPDDQALFVGDLFGWGLIPSGGLDGRMAKLLLDTYGRLIEFGAGVVVPGHGPVCTTAELERWTEYFRWLVEQVREACAAGKSDREILRDVAPPADMADWWRFLQWKHADSLSKVLHAVRRGPLSV